MSAFAVTEVSGRARPSRARFRRVGEAVSEYVHLIAHAQRTWLGGVAIAVGLAWLNAVPGIYIPFWAAAATVIATAVLAQFQAFYRVRDEREAQKQGRVIEGIMDEIAVLRTREMELRSVAIRDYAAYAEWRATFIALRALIHKKLESVSRAEAETFHTVGNLTHTATGGVCDEHNMLLSVAARDLDHLADLIHGYTRVDRARSGLQANGKE